MRKLFSYVFVICALVALGILIYQAIPIFPYINDIHLLRDGVAFLLCYYLAYRLSDEKNNITD